MIRFCFFLLAVGLAIALGYFVLLCGAPVIVSELVGGATAALFMTGSLVLLADVSLTEACDARTRIRGRLKVTGPGRVVVRGVIVDGDIEVTSIEAK